MKWLHVVTIIIGLLFGALSDGGAVSADPPTDQMSASGKQAEASGLFTMNGSEAVDTVSDAQNSLVQITQFVRVKGILISIFLVFISALLLKAVNKTIEKLGDQFTQRRLLLQKMETFFQFFVYLIVGTSTFFLCFQVDGRLLAIIGGTGAVALGFALKDLLSSIIAGLTIMMDRPFQVGDRVEFDGSYGDIISIGLRSVRMRTLNDSVVNIPNNNFLSGVSASGNYGNMYMMVKVNFYLALDSDLARAREIVYEAAASSRYIYLSRPINVYVRQMALENLLVVRIRLRAYIMDPKVEEDFETDVNVRVMQAFRQAGIQTPILMVASTGKPGNEAAVEA